MKKSKSTDSQIMEALKRVEAGLSVLRSAGSWVSVPPPFTSGVQVWRHGCIYHRPAERTGSREQ